MRAPVYNGFYAYTVRKEGFTTFPYCDVINLVTTGVGNLQDFGDSHPSIKGATEKETWILRAAANTEVSPRAYAPMLALKWYIRAPGWTSGQKDPMVSRVATQEEVIDAWTACKVQNAKSPGFAQRGGMAYAPLTNITLDKQGMQNLFYGTLNNFNAGVSDFLPRFEDAPGDAQFAVMSMAWAMGVNRLKDFKKFIAAFNVEDYLTAAKESYFKGVDDTPTNRQGRNKDNFAMLNYAADVVREGADRNVLRFFRPEADDIASHPPASGGTPAGFPPPMTGLTKGVLVAGVLGAGFWLGKKYL